MTVLVDVVNFNADASCMSAAKWLDILKGGPLSLMYRWLGLYVRLRKKMVIGFTGATVADLATINPDSIALVNSHPEIFQVIWRPFAHDVGLLRTSRGFTENATLGWEVIKREFPHAQKYFLPPEFMITNEQVGCLCRNGTRGIFIYPQRFSVEIQRRIPKAPYKVKGLLGCKLTCYPFDSEATEVYLDAIHRYETSRWNQILIDAAASLFFCWRDGESSFLVPNGIEREEFWLSGETQTIERKFLTEIEDSVTENCGNTENDRYLSYPVHSFSAWMQELRMLGFIKRAQQIEERLDALTTREKAIWLQVINSDILSAVEKQPPQIKMRLEPDSHLLFECTLQRSERGFEGEEFLYLLEMVEKESQARKYLEHAQAPHMIKLRGRMQYLDRLEPRNDGVKANG
ncbi:MAG: hypothetical protein ABIK07_13595 [Planctomycetota bacterium]